MRGDWYLVDGHRRPRVLGGTTAGALAGDDATVLDQLATPHTPRFGALDRTRQAILSELALAADRLRASGVHVVLREEQVGQRAVTVRAARPCHAAIVPRTSTGPWASRWFGLPFLGFVQVADRGIAMSRQVSWMRRGVCATLAFSLAVIDVAAPPVGAGQEEYSPRSAKVTPAADVPQSSIDAHAADVALARGLESSRVVAADESGPVPLPIGGGAVPLPDGDATAFEPPVVTPTDDGVKGVLPQPPPPADKPEGATADGFDAGSSVEVNERPDAFTTVFEDADGTRALLVSSVPVNFEDGLGGWKKIDNRVVSDGAGGLTNAANEWRVTFGVMQAGRGGDDFNVGW